jgi:RNA polymerase sigma factor (sigma-70 family)
MQPRRTVTEIFSTFVGFENDRFQQWLTEPALRRNLQRQEAFDETQADGTTQDFWVLYWHRVWGDGTTNGVQRFALEHLTAYLQESCYWVAQRTARQRQGIQYGVADCFQMAIATVPALLKSYSPAQGASLATYARLCFSNAIRDVLRQQREMTSRSDWGLLRKVSQKQVIEALQASGLGAEQIAAYRRAWMAYKTCWAGQTAATRQLSAPDAQTWQAIASLYNTQLSSESSAAMATVTAATIEQWLKELVRALRRFLNPAVVSLNVPKFEDGGERQDDLPAAAGDNPWTALVQREELQARQHQRTQISDRLQTATAALKPQDRQLLVLYYVRNNTQQQIAEQLQVKQYTVSRRLSRIKESLLLTLATWSQETLHISLTSPVLKQVSIVLEEWLQNNLNEDAMKESLLKE